MKRKDWADAPGIGKWEMGARRGYEGGAARATAKKVMRDYKPDPKTFETKKKDPGAAATAGATAGSVAGSEPTTEKADMKMKATQITKTVKAARPTSDRKQDKEVDGSSGIRMDVHYPGTNAAASEDIKAGRETVKAKSDKTNPPPVKHNSDRMFEEPKGGAIEYGTKRKKRAGGY